MNKILTEMDGKTITITILLSLYVIGILLCFASLCAARYSSELVLLFNYKVNPEAKKLWKELKFDNTSVRNKFIKFCLKENILNGESILIKAYQSKFWFTRIINDSESVELVREFWTLYRLDEITNGKI